MNNDHIELVFNGLYDRINGNETYASRYLDGVIWANEPSNMFVSGNEGFLDNVSSGLKKAWEYIKKLLIAIKEKFSSFFKSKQIKETVKTIEEVSKEPSFESTPEIKEKLSKASAKVNQIISTLNSISDDVKTVKDYLETDSLLSNVLLPYVSVLTSEKERLVKSLEIIDGGLKDKLSTDLLFKCKTTLNTIERFSTKYTTAANAIQTAISNVEKNPHMEKTITEARIKALKWILSGLGILAEQMILTANLIEKIAKIK